MKKKKILFVLPNLKAGGSERVISFVSQNLNKDKFETRLIVLGHSKDSMFKISSIPVDFLNKNRLLTSSFELIKKIHFEKPDVVISTISHLNIFMGILSIFFRKTKFIGRESSVISKMQEYTSVNQRLYNFLIKITYNQLSVIICQSEDMRIDFIERYKINPDKLILIHNPITGFLNPIRHQLNPKLIRFITVGRLSREKGYSRILLGLSKIRGYSFTYTVIGSGSMGDEIKALAMQLGLSKFINYIPSTTEVEKYLASHDVYLQGSFVEGFPNALMESCAVGTPVIAFNCPGGTREIIINGANGYLVENQTEFELIISKIENFNHFNLNIIKNSVIDKFNSKVIINKYESILNSSR